MNPPGHDGPTPLFRGVTFRPHFGGKSSIFKKRPCKQRSGCMLDPTHWCVPLTYMYLSCGHRPHLPGPGRKIYQI